jgi:hypothetical protein
MYRAASFIQKKYGPKKGKALYMADALLFWRCNNTHTPNDTYKHVYRPQRHAAV